MTARQIEVRVVAKGAGVGKWLAQRTPFNTAVVDGVALMGEDRRVERVRDELTGAWGPSMLSPDSSAVFIVYDMGDVDADDHVAVLQDAIAQVNEAIGGVLRDASIYATLDVKVG